MFDAQARLVAVDATHDASEASAAQSLAAERIDALSASLGPASRRRGELTAAHLEGGPLRRATAEFRYRNRRTSVAATHLGQGRFSVRETHQRL